MFEKTLKNNVVGLLTLLCLAGASQQALAQQSDNHALHAVPAGKAVVDGKLDDWDLSGQIEVYANFKTRNSDSAKVAAMYDKDNHGQAGRAVPPARQRAGDGRPVRRGPRPGCQVTMSSRAARRTT